MSLSGFGLRRFGSAGLGVGFFLFFGAAQALLALLEALLGMFGLELLLFQVANFRLGGAVNLALDDTPMDAKLRAYLKDAFAKTGDFLRNRGEA